MEPQKTSGMRQVTWVLGVVALLVVVVAATTVSGLQHGDGVPDREESMEKVGEVGYGYPVFEHGEETKRWLEELSTSSGWQMLELPNGPSPRVYAASTTGAPVPPPYDPSDRSGIAIFGGTNNATSYEEVFGDLWVLNAQDTKSGDGRVWTQIQLYADAPAPAARAMAAIAIDPTSSVLYLFGGFDGKQWYNDLWGIVLTPIQFPGETATWFKVLDSDSGPVAPRCGAGLFWLSVEKAQSQYQEVLVLFGGGGPRLLYNDTYYYAPNEASQMTWSYVNTLYPPDARDMFSSWVAPDRMYVYGGSNYGYDFFNDTRYYATDGTDMWYQVDTYQGDASPPSRCCAQLAYSPTRDRALMFGGRDFKDVLFDLWFFDSSYQDWIKVSQDLSAEGPGPIFGAAFGYFLQGDGLIIVGGASDPLDEPTSYVWFYPFSAIN